ncbi:MAG: hypothetical protein COU34_03890 [Candidatus Magasanikbacteria bacterium CG10_big_fil_rev_8_21_14_0_10_43_9]|nr:MAG: hypothetical protein COU34_03890 [Candidatus Magasanikbacteria bacterium CG10_big_fil_rev_8_21_14_0_10_43_9]
MILGGGKRIMLKDFTRLKISDDGEEWENFEVTGGSNVWTMVSRGWTVDREKKETEPRLSVSLKIDSKQEEDLNTGKPINTQLGVRPVYVQLCATG